ncbi:MAG TPA: tetratricopeptide repeat protein, partial [Pyrinomonadaceae bacterium]
MTRKIGNRTTVYRAMIFAAMWVLPGSVSFAQSPSPSPTPDAAAIEKLKAEREKALKLNALITDFNAHIAAKDWLAAEATANDLIAADPRPEYYTGLANMQMNQGKYDSAVANYDRAVSGIGTWDQIKAADAAIRQKATDALINKGAALIRLKRENDAIKVYKRAAEIAPKPGTAYFNLCAMAYNLGRLDDAVAACSRAIEVDPERADAYFIKGSALVGNSTAGP